MIVCIIFVLIVFLRLNSGDKAVEDNEDDGDETKIETKKKNVNKKPE